MPKSSLAQSKRTAPSITQGFSGNVEQPFQLFQRANTQNWCVRFSIKGQGQIRKSLATPDYNEAMVRASRLYYEAVIRAENGLEARKKTVKVISDEWLAVAKLTPSEMTVATRYIIPYFDNTAPSDITPRRIADFIEWRTNYWITGPGKDQEFISYKRDGKEIKRPVDRNIPKTSTLHSVEALLSKFMRYCLAQGHITKMPEFRKVTVKASARPGFTDEEVNFLTTVAATDYQNPKSSDAERFRDGQLYHFIGFMCATGLRPTEAMRLKWNDITKFDPTYEGPVRKSKTLILVHGKGKSRTAVGTDSLDIHLKALWDLYERIWGEVPGRDDWLWAHKDKTPVQSFNSRLNDLLERTKLKLDYRGIKRDAYSFRHYYATTMLANKVPVFNVAKNMGTGVNMLEKHYSHNTTESMRDTFNIEGHSL